MRKGKLAFLTILVFSLVLFLSGCSSTPTNQENNAQGSQTAKVKQWRKEAYKWNRMPKPEIFRLNSSPNFNKEAIRNWAKKYSWSKAWHAASGTWGGTGAAWKENREKESGTFREIEIGTSGDITATLYTPSFSWIEARGLKKKNGWTEEQTQDRYEKYTSRPNSRAYIECRIATPVRSIYKNNELRVEEDNIEFVLEDKDGDRWKAKVDAEKREVSQTRDQIAYSRVFHLWFHFRDKAPEWKSLTLSIIRRDIGLQTRSFTWNFGKRKSTD